MTNTFTELHDIRPPVEIPLGWAWLWWLLAALALGVAAWLARHFWLEYRAARMVIPPPVPAHERAKQKLQEALALIAEPKPFCTLVSDTIRYYLEERFKFRAPERTTEEFLHELRGTDRLLPDQKESLGAFLNRCDLVKFARHQPTEPELCALQASALRLVEETEETAPAPSPTTVKIESPRRAARGKAFGIAGTALQIAPFVWMTYFAVLFFKLVETLERGEAMLGDSEAKNQFYTNTLMSWFGDMLSVTVATWTVSLLGLILLTVALVSGRYRAQWIFWFCVPYGIFLLPAFPFGTAFGIFFLVYCLKRHREFLKHPAKAT